MVISKLEFPKSELEKNSVERNKIIFRPINTLQMYFLYYCGSAQLKGCVVPPNEWNEGEVPTKQSGERRWKLK